MGVLAIYKLLEQKEGFTSLDQEILGLLAAQAAATLIGARTFTRGGGVLEWAPDDDGRGVARRVEAVHRGAGGPAVKFDLQRTGTAPWSSPGGG